MLMRSFCYPVPLVSALVSVPVYEKGTGAYREANWEEALDFAAAGFLKVKEKYRPEALISHSGRGTFDQATSEYLMKTGFFEPLGSPNISNVGSICANSFFVMAPVTTFGPLRSITPDIAHADRIIDWGANPITK
jgi:anaerobic selenocysteine-containing dehydrogenase